MFSANSKHIEPPDVIQSYSQSLIWTTAKPQNCGIRNLIPTTAHWRYGPTINSHNRLKFNRPPSYPVYMIISYKKGSSKKFPMTVATVMYARLFKFLECFPLLMATLIFSILTSIFVITTCLPSWSKLLRRHCVSLTLSLSSYSYPVAPTIRILSMVAAVYLKV